MQQFLAQHCRNFIALLQATHEPAFPALSPVTLDRFLRVLAYVRKDDDAIPDYTPSGYTDDRDEVRATVELLARELEQFKAWRLQHQVPGMWMTKPGALVVVTPNLN
jgi:hypothetical protein